METGPPPEDFTGEEDLKVAVGKGNSQKKVSFRTFIDRRTGLKVKIIISKPKIPLVAKISKIDMKGLMTV